MAMKTVCIVGAGPSGLASAKVLLQSKSFHVTIFEKKDRIGGIWAIDRMSPHEGYLHPDTPTNLSRFTVAFSDLDWNAIGLDSVPMFPKAWQVNQYLEAYRTKNIPSDCFRFRHHITKTEKTATSWRVTALDGEGREHVQDFNYLLIGSGFFSQPRPIKDNVPNVATALKVKTMHSSEFRTLDDLFANRSDVADQKILMIGGGNSAGEAAAAVAQQLSDASWSPGKGRKEQYKSCKIVHITPRPLYALPPYNPTDTSNVSLLPLDLKLYELSKRPPGPIVANAGQLTQAVKDMIHNALQAQIGGDQSDLGSSALVIPPSEPRSAVYVALSETYPEFVRSGLIEVHSGRVVEISNAEDGTCVTQVQGADGTFTIENVGAVIYATGYSPITAIDFLPLDVSEKLQICPSSMRLPLILSGWQTMSEAMPEMAFIGFYEGPYWPMIEMQARFTAQRWLAEQHDCPVPRYEEPAALLKLREAMRNRSQFVPQYWFGDYLGYVEELAAHLQLARNDGAFAEREGPISPARYLSAGDDEAQAKAIVQDLHYTWLSCTTHGKYVARATFRALQGKWRLNRNIDSRLSSFPSGVLEGEASFHPRSPTPDKSGEAFDLEYLYQETGVLRLQIGAAMTARRSYVYRYSEAKDQLSIWFVKPESDLEVDYLFHNLQFAYPSEAKAQGACSASADHLCVEDMYWTKYSFPFSGISLRSFTTTHTVKGPSKDYTMVTQFSRPTPATVSI
ncbi:uncharacterized protein RHO25_001456 [Cercospora beticola]|uniref:DUF6314 domain-containing protein n=2 Tax=Cercospora beticola TaxID=122368 RepID=A0ABZ0NBE7_CERBT|nr:hypothetical protein RHO25_001456 [Cercospora beticola]